MGFVDRHMGKIFSALIFLSGVAALWFLYDTHRALRTDVSLPAPLSANEVRTEQGEAPTLQPKTHYDLIARRNIFTFPDEPKAAEKPAVAQVQQPVISNLNAQLKGTIVSPEGFALAMIEDRVQRKEDLYIVGDKIQDAEIVDIHSDRVVLRRGETEEILALFAEPEPGGPRRSPPSRARAPRAEEPPRPPVEREDPQTVAEKRQIQQKVRSLMAQLRLRPHFDKGKPSGFVVGQVREGTIFEAGGLKKGDIIVAINDEEVLTPNQLLKAYREIVEDEELWIDVIREGGEEDTIDIDLEGVVGE